MTADNGKDIGFVRIHSTPPSADELVLKLAPCTTLCADSSPSIKYSFEGEIQHFCARKKGPTNFGGKCNALKPVYVRIDSE